MVRTRNNGNGSDLLRTGLPAAGYRRHQTRLLELEDSEESDFSPLMKRRRIIAAGRSSQRNGFAMALDEDKSLRRGRAKRLIAGRNTVEHMNSKDREVSKSSELVNGIRRSTRQRKFTYDTLNQRWLLGGSGRYREFTSIVDDVPVTDEQKQKQNQEFEESLNHADAFEEDMYTRVKRERRKASRNFYKLTDRTTKNRQHDAADDSSNEETCSEIEADEDDEAPDEDVEEEEDDDDEIGLGSNDCGREDTGNTKYYLRQKKPVTDRFQSAIDVPQRRKPSQSVFHISAPRRHTRDMDFRSPFRSPAHRSSHITRRRHATHNSSSSISSSSSSSEDERRFERRKSKSMARARNRCLPMNIAAEDVANSQVISDRRKIGSSLADVDPMAVDRAVTFDGVGGHNNHIQSLKEMLLLPLMYPEVFEKLKILPPRGVLFYGPPGTGKTLMARALANECSQGERRVAFFMRKGADCLSKWVGESERQLRLLFDQAYCMRPSIIFFDEIDGLAPVRSTRQDQIHSSIVSTLLALMDGLDNRGEVVVIGATNRIDAIDPALRRPGRFDREFNFPLPSLESRLTILKIHTKEWNPPLSEAFLEELAEKTAGYCGADLKGLCAEAAFFALRRRYPQIYQSRKKLLLDVSSIKIENKDFFKALSLIVPVKQRSAVASSRPLPPVVRPLLLGMLNSVLEALKQTFPQGFNRRWSADDRGVSNDVADYSSEEDNTTDEPLHINSRTAVLNGVVSGTMLKSTVGLGSTYRNRCGFRYLSSHRPRMILSGKKGQGQSTHLAPAVLHYLEKFPTHKLDLPSLYAVTAKSPEESCAQIFLEAQRNLPSILYLPHIDQWWDTLSDTVRATFLTLLNDLEPTTPVLFFATSNCCLTSLPDEIRELFDPCQGEVYQMRNPTKVERRQFFADLILYETKRPPKMTQQQPAVLESLPLAPPPEPRIFSEAELKKIREQEENTLRELRLFLREILYKLTRDRRFSFFAKPVDTEEVSDYLQVIREPMDLETMMTKIDFHKYETVSEFLDDIDLICHNALEYNPDRDPSDKIIRHRACALRDSAHCLVSTELDPEFEDICQEIKKAKKSRGDSPSKFAPNHYRSLPKPPVTTSKSNVEKNEEIQSAITSDTNLNIKSDSHSEKSVNSNCAKRYSRRLRGLEVSVQQLETSACIAGNLEASSQNESCQHRYKRGLWFGQRRRVRPRLSFSCSDDSAETRMSVRQKSKVTTNSIAAHGDESTKEVSRETSGLQTSAAIRSGALNAVGETCLNSVEAPYDTLEASLYSSDHSLDSGRRLCSETNSAKLGESDTSLSAVEMDSEKVGNVDKRGEGASALQDALDASKQLKNATHVEELEAESEAAAEISNKELADQYDERESPAVVIDQARLGYLLDTVVSKTENATLECLEKIHCRIYQLIRGKRQEWNKTVLLNEMEKEIRSLSIS